jgi:hypothetical protein
MKCILCNRLTIQIGTTLYSCPFCGKGQYKNANIVCPSGASGVISVPKNSHPKHE